MLTEGAEEEEEEDTTTMGNYATHAPRFHSTDQ